MVSWDPLFLCKDYGFASFTPGTRADSPRLSSRVRHRLAPLASRCAPVGSRFHQEAVFTTKGNLTLTQRADAFCRAGCLLRQVPKVRFLRSGNPTSREDVGVILLDY